MDSQSISSENGVQTRKKRVLPTRSRRGGPGVGTCDVDMMILDTNKRRPENEPLIPVDTPFLLTTNSVLVDDLSTNAELGLNIHANERYFDRPEVLRSFREQSIIETPEYVHVADSPSVGVGGRFRPRGSGDNAIDTSDAAYEKRHRKYESFEKRLRLREKEKLKHEHYKLKERIEQLRAMDSSAFLSLPASSFPEEDGQRLENSDNSVDGTISPHVTHANGSCVFTEGERRRREMLDVALALEERYRVLLPSERIRKANMNAWAEQDIRHSEEKEETIDSEEGTLKEKEASRIKLKFKLPSRKETPPAQTPVKRPRQINLPPPKPSPLRYTRATSRYHTEEPPPFGGLSQPVTPGDIADLHDTTVTAPSEDTGTMEVTAMSPRESESAEGTSVPPPSIPATPISNPEIAVLEGVTSPRETSMQEDELQTHDQTPSTVSDVCTPKRPRLLLSPQPTLHITPYTSQIPGQGVLHRTPIIRETSMPPIESINTSLSAPLVMRIKQQKQKPIALRRVRQQSVPKQHQQQLISSAGAAGKLERTGCMLMVAAVRSSGGIKSRNTMRHITAFGAKVPQEIDEIRDFELPGWVVPHLAKDLEDSDVTGHVKLELEHIDKVTPAENGVLDTPETGGTPMRKQKGAADDVGPVSSVLDSSTLMVEPPIEVLHISESSVRDLP
ncbi:hypothetical protein AX17_000251 [Amanita inopinata Kibby_2008]|nr:hypothetical protein AX17_000251 [Amanita inopinata Kibby_2008]